MKNKPSTGDRGNLFLGGVCISASVFFGAMVYKIPEFQFLVAYITLVVCIVSGLINTYSGWKGTKLIKEADKDGGNT